MIEWEKMSNFAAGNKSYSASPPLGTYSDSSKTRTRQVRSTSVSGPFQVRSVYWREISPMIGIRASEK